MKKLLECDVRGVLRSKAARTLVGIAFTTLFCSAAFAGVAPIGSKIAARTGLSASQIQASGVRCFEGSMSEIGMGLGSKFEDCGVARPDMAAAGFAPHTNSATPKFDEGGNTLFNGACSVGRDGSGDGVGGPMAILSEKFISHALVSAEISGTSLSERAGGAVQSEVRFLDLDVERTVSAEVMSTREDSSSPPADGSRNGGLVQSFSIYSFGTSRNDSQNSVVYVPLPQATQAGVLVLVMIGLGQVRRNRLNRA